MVTGIRFVITLSINQLILISWTLTFIRAVNHFLTPLAIAVLPAIGRFRAKIFLPLHYAAYAIDDMIRSKRDLRGFWTIVL